MDSSTEIKFSSTADAREQAGTLDTGAVYFQSLVAELENAKKNIVANWQGDTTDIADINNRIDMVTLTFKDKVIPSLQQLSGSIKQAADSFDKNAEHEVDSGPQDMPSQEGTYVETPTTGATQSGGDGFSPIGAGVGAVAGMAAGSALGGKICLIDLWTLNVLVHSKQ